MNAYSALADDCYSNMNLSTEMPLPTNRETILGFFERLQKSYPTMRNFYTRDNGDLVLEEDKDQGHQRWLSIEARRINSGFINPTDLDAALAFYRDLLGLKVVMRLDPDNSGPEGSIAAGLDIAGVLVPGGTMLELVQGMQEPRASSTVGALNVADVKTAQQQVEAAGVTPAMPPTEVTPGVTMMFLTDPDGRNVELVEFASGASSNYANLDAPSAS